MLRVLISRVLGWLVVSSLLLNVTNSNSLTAQVTYRTVAITGMAAPGPGVPPAAKFSFQFAPISVINSLGHTAFTASITGAGSNNWGIWREDESADMMALRKVVRSGEAAPGLGAGVVFRNFFDTVRLSETMILPNTSDIGFRASLSGPGINRTNNNGIWHFGGAHELVAQIGTAAPGAGGALFTGFGPSDRPSFVILTPGGLPIITPDVASKA